MKLSLSYRDLEQRLHVSLPPSERIIHAVAFDTRRIVEGKGILFFALKGEFRDGHDFLKKAYDKGVRTFVVAHKRSQDQFPEAAFILVENPLEALQNLAKAHREQFDIPVVGITGSSGKTIVKEWLGQMLDSKLRVVRSPKSYNSQLGVALSLLEINETSEIALIEAGISSPGEMEKLANMIQPTHGIFTSLGSAHANNFASRDAQMLEKEFLFNDCEKVIVHHSIPVNSNDQRYKIVHEKSYSSLLDHLPFQDEISRHNAVLALVACRLFDLSDDEIAAQIKKLDRMALRLETFDGIGDCVIINDTYNLDLDAFRSSLEYQLSIAQGKTRIVIVGTDDNHDSLKQILADFEPVDYYFVEGPDTELPDFKNAIVLIKGKRQLHMEQLALRLRTKKHQTFVEVNLSAIRHNLSYLKSQLPEKTDVLAMVKASSYGSGIDEIGRYLEHLGVNYLGVAYVDEGIQLREAGVQLPILVMNTEDAGFEDCIRHQLEPSIYSINQLDSFIKQLIYSGVSNYPIHIKIETGMNRLGFSDSQIDELLRVLQSQPEVVVKSVYSHLATSDQQDSPFVHTQVERFETISKILLDRLPYPVKRHILNSEGILNFPQYHFDMVRVGIGMYGVTSNLNQRKHLRNVVQWHSAVSQIRKVTRGESIGYGQAGIVENEMQIAIIPVGYADGFRRSLSMGKGGVYIQNEYCPVIGNVCMDMIMVDTGQLKVRAGEEVEIIGVNQSLDQLSQKMDTIPYEVLTGISKRVHRVYVED